MNENAVVGASGNASSGPSEANYLPCRDREHRDLQSSPLVTSQYALDGTKKGVQMIARNLLMTLHHYSSLNGVGERVL